MRFVDVGKSEPETLSQGLETGRSVQHHPNSAAMYTAQDCSTPNPVAIGPTKKNTTLHTQQLISSIFGKFLHPHQSPPSLVKSREPEEPSLTGACPSHFALEI